MTELLLPVFKCLCNMYVYTGSVLENVNRETRRDDQCCKCPRQGVQGTKEGLNPIGVQYEQLQITVVDNKKYVVTVYAYGGKVYTVNLLMNS